MFGAWCALGGAKRLQPILASPIVFWVAVAYLSAAFSLTMTWYFPQLEAFVPGWLAYWITRSTRPISTSCALRISSRSPCGPAFRAGQLARLAVALGAALILCGQYSLQIFALGVALSFAGYALLMELDAGVALHFIVGAVGILILYGVARTFTWYKHVTAAPARAKAPATSPAAPTSESS